MITESMFLLRQMGDYMSSDEIFAAQMWPWPDPMLKRNAEGRILFVNAAFLRIYGGQVQDWHGNSVGGWPLPLGGPAPNRFETRLPTPQGEMVFDWVEYTLADGGTLGLGRDVTELLTAPEPDPGYNVQPPEQPAYQEQTAYQEQAPAAQYAPAQHLPAADNAVVQAPPAQAQEVNAPQAAPAAFGVAPQNTTVPKFDIPTYEADPVHIPDVEVPQINTPHIETPAYETPPETAAPQPAVQEPVATNEETPAAPLAETQTQPASQQVNEQASEQAAPAPLQPADRDYERRALPIENQDAVLGTNWRDAVIAKAVGNVLPSSEENSEEPQPAEPAANNSEGALRILLAEDNAINALLTRTLLEADGCHVDVVEDGQLAVEAMKNQSYDMIFMDMRMPNMDGLESTRKIRALPNVAKDLPIVALTANAFDDDRNACFDSGMNDFMTKPVSAEELQDMVNQWARKKAEAA